MSNDTKSPHHDASATVSKKLSLRRERVRVLDVKSGVKTGGFSVCPYFSQTGVDTESCSCTGTQGAKI